MDVEQIKPNQKQISSTLQFIHDTQSEDVKQAVFGELGRQCFCATGMKDQFETIRGKPEEYLKRVNDEHSVMYWESILPGEDGNSYILTGVPVNRCVCSFADGDNTPLSLCDYCCRNFQKQLFGVLFDREVEIEITASYLKGDGRCSTVIRKK